MYNILDVRKSKRKNLKGLRHRMNIFLFSAFLFGLPMGFELQATLLESKINKKILLASMKTPLDPKDCSEGCRIN